MKSRKMFLLVFVLLPLLCAVWYTVSAMPVWRAETRMNTFLALIEVGMKRSDVHQVVGADYLFFVCDTTGSDLPQIYHSIDDYYVFGDPKLGRNVRLQYEQNRGDVILTEISLVTYDYWLPTEDRYCKRINR